MDGLILHGGSFLDSLYTRLMGDDLHDVLKSAQNITEVRTIAPSVGNITFAGHSSKNLIRPGRSVTDHSPKDLAGMILQKYGEDKTKLTDFYLASCEVGLTENGTSFAKEFSKEMHELGFTALKVHAICSPEGSQPTGMIVETLGPIDDRLRINSWCYKSSKDDERDQAIKVEIDKLEKQTADIDAQLGMQIKRDYRTQLKTQKNTIKTTISKLEQEQETLRLYVCKKVNYKEEMNQPYNTFLNGVQQALMSQEVADAINCLKGSLWGGDGKNIERIQTAIGNLQKAPSSTREGIIRIVTDARGKSLLDGFRKQASSYDDIITRVSALSAPPNTADDEKKAPDVEVAVIWLDEKSHALTVENKNASFHFMENDKEKNIRCISSILATLKENPNSTLAGITQIMNGQKGIDKSIVTELTDHMAYKKNQRTEKQAAAVPETKSNPPTDPNFFFAWLKSLLVAIIAFCTWALGSDKQAGVSPRPSEGTPEQTPPSSFGKR